MHIKNVVAIAAGTLLGLSAPAWAQNVAAAGLKVGATVYSPDGSEVAKVEKIDGETVTINTGTNTVALGSDSFVKGPKGPAIGLTKPKLDEAIETARKEENAKLDAALVAGAAVQSADGKAVGSIQSVKSDGSVVIKGETQSFALPRDHFTADESGVKLRLTAQQLAEAMAKPAPGK